jgi:hypothetical protein
MGIPYPGWQLSQPAAQSMTILSGKLPFGSQRRHHRPRRYESHRKTTDVDLRGAMREFGVRRYGDTVYHHCLAEEASDAASWFARSHSETAGKDFQALVKDLGKPVTDETGLGDNPSVVVVRHGDLTQGSQHATDLKRTSLVR